MFSVKKAIATFVVILLYSSGLILLSCAKSDKKWFNTDTPQHDPKHYWEEKFERKGLTVKPGSGFQKALGGDAATGGIGLTRINDFLWNASLTTLSFMPLNTVDALGGVLITDWYTKPDDVETRVKVAVYFLTTELRTDGIIVNVYKEKSQNGIWVAASSDPSVADKIHNQILESARKSKAETLAIAKSQ